MIYKIKIKGIYENPGVVPSAQRIADRDTDVVLLTNQAGTRQHYAPAANEEFITPFGNGAGTKYERYGFGFVSVEWLVLAPDASAVGAAIFNRLNTRGMQDGSYIEVYGAKNDQGGAVAANLLYQRTWPRATSVDIG